MQQLFKTVILIVTIDRCETKVGVPCNGYICKNGGKCAKMNGKDQCVCEPGSGFVGSSCDAFICDPKFNSCEGKHLFEVVFGLNCLVHTSWS